MRKPSIAVILCGGFGTRMAQYANDLPKPLVPVLGKPIVSHIIDNLRRNGIKQFVLLTGYKHEKFCQTFGHDNSILIVDTLPGTDTADRLKLAQKFINSEDFLLTYGDSIIDFNLFKASSIIGDSYGMAVFKRQLSYGVVEIDNEEKITKFSEKPVFYCNAGHYILSKKIFADSRLLAAKNLEREYFPLLIADPGECPPIKAFEVFIHETIDSGEDVLRFENKYSGCDVLPWH